MYAEKFELLEAKIRETAMLVSRLREEKRQLEWENEQLRARVAELEAQLQGSHREGDRYEPDLDHLLEQLDTLQQGEEPPLTVPAPTASQEPPEHGPPQVEDHVQRGMFYEQQGQYEPAIYAYQRALEIDGENLVPASGKHDHRCAGALSFRGINRECGLRDIANVGPRFAGH